MASKNDFNNSTIGEGSVFEGKFYINGSLRIDGKFEGEIKTDEELVVGETGKVRTNINAKMFSTMDQPCFIHSIVFFCKP